MFATLSRGSFRTRNAYICSFCLGHADPQLSRFSIGQTVVAPNSTTSFNQHADENGDQDKGSDRAADGQVKGEGKVQTMKVFPSDVPKGGRKGRRRPPTLQISTSKETLAALKASLLAEEEAPATSEHILAKYARRSQLRKARKERAKMEKPSQAGKEDLDKESLESLSKEPGEAAAESVNKADPIVEAAEKSSKSAKTKKSTMKRPSPKSPTTSTNSKKVPKTEKLKSGNDSKKDENSSKTPSSDDAKFVKKAGVAKRADSKTPLGKAAKTVKKVGLEQQLFSEKGEKDTSDFKIKRISGDMTYDSLKQWQSNLIRGIHAHTISGTAMRKALIKIIQDGRLSKEDTNPAVKLLRSTLIRPGVVTPSPLSFKSLKNALQSNLVARKQSGVTPFRVSRILSTPVLREQPPQRLGMPRGPPSRLTKPKSRTPPGPVVAVRGMTAHEIKTIDPDHLKLTALDNGPLNVPNLSYGLERVLFNPGVYHLQDPRSRVFNFDPYLQTIMPVSEFDFNALKQYITSSRDKALLSAAVTEKRKYTGSTSSMTSALGHFHFLLSQWRPINTETLSQKFPVEYNSFTTLQRGPVAIFLRWRDGTYAIDADKQFDSANILSMLGKSMEKLLTLPKEGFERYRKQNSDDISEEERNEDEAFHYTTMGDFLMRSQLDAHDSRLPGTGMFDLKTRAVVSIRMDTSQYEEGSGYEIRGRHGEWESFEREYYDMIRAAFLKYSLQVRMGRMDGIFVAFHNTERIFGFQYISLPEMDLALHGTENLITGDSEFKLSLELLNRVLDRATAKYPESSLRIHFETRDAATPFMYIFAEPVKEEQIEKIQETNKAEIEEFESRVLGLAKADVSEDQRQAEWDSLRAKVEESMEQDEMGTAAAEEEMIEDEHESEIWDEHERKQVEEILSAAAQEDGAQDDEENEDDDELVEAEELEGDIDEKEDSIDENNEDIEIEEQENQLDEGSEETAVEDVEKVLEGDTFDSDVEEVDEGGEVSGIDEVEESEVSESLESDESDNSDDSEPTDLVENEDLVAAKEFTEPYEDSSEALREDIEDGQYGIPPLPTHTIIHPEGPIFGMTLAIRNKVNGRYVDRPENLTKDDKWTVEYALAEVPEEQRARALYETAKQRRSKILSKVKDNAKDDAWNNQYIKNIKNMSRKGREWRHDVDEKEKDVPKKVLDVRDWKNMANTDRDIWVQESGEPGK